jgi:ECF sigma factor
MTNDETKVNEPTHSITNTINGHKEGNKDAPSELVRLLEEKLRLLTRIEKHLKRKCPESLRTRIDCEGLVYRALHDFLLGVRADKFPDLSSRENVRKLVVRRARLLLKTEIRNNERMIRDGRRDVHGESLVEQLCARPTNEGAPMGQRLDEDQRPNSHQHGQCLDRAREILCGAHPTAIYVLEGLLGGRSVSQIARSKKLGCGNVRNIIRLMTDALVKGDHDGKARAVL